MGNRSRWWPFGRRKTEVGDQYTMIATAELRRERAEKAMAIRERDVERKAKEEAEKSRDWWKERAENALKASTQHKEDRDDYRRQLDDCKAIKGKLASRVDKAERARDEWIKNRPKLFAQIEPSTAGRGRKPCFRFGIYGSENPGPDERPLCVSDYNGVPTKTEAKQVLAIISGGRIVVPSEETTAD